MDGTARSSREVLAACHRGLALPELVRQASAGLSRAVAFDRSCWHSIDPATAMLTGAVKDNFQVDAASPATNAPSRT